MTKPTRLSKIMSQRGMCSRREADFYISQGMVRVDGKIMNTPGCKVDPDQKICFTKDAKAHQSSQQTVLLNKPPGLVSGLPEKGYYSAVMLITPENALYQNDSFPGRRGLAPAGRLDIDSSGLIVYTQDGRIARQLVGEGSNIEKEYIVSVMGEITEPKIHRLAYGIKLDGQLLRKAEIIQTGAQQLKFILRQGRQRQIRRMCELVDLEVTKLVRTRIGKVKLANIPRGKWRLLGRHEQF